jgi:hypothetical protein
MPCLSVKRSDSARCRRGICSWLQQRQAFPCPDCACAQISLNAHARRTLHVCTCCACTDETRCAAIIDCQVSSKLIRIDDAAGGPCEQLARQYCVESIFIVTEDDRPQRRTQTFSRFRSRSQLAPSAAAARNDCPATARGGSEHLTLDLQPFVWCQPSATIKP